MIGPCGIGSISHPLTEGRDANGNRIYASVKMQLATVSAMDKGIWASMVQTT